MSLTKPSVISSTWFKESPLIPKEGIFLTINPLRRAAALLFTPFIGPHGLIRSFGRLRRLVEIDFDTKHPIVLDARHTFVKLILRHTHLKNHLRGIDYLRSKVQERYAILKLRSTLRSTKSNCVLCRKFPAATIQPIMADLPKKRLAYQSPPFTNTGLITSAHSASQFVGHEKRWGFLFTCLTTRAVHVEFVPSMDTSSCVMGVERFPSIGVLLL